MERTVKYISSFKSSKIHLFLVIQISQARKRGRYFRVFPRLTQEETLWWKFDSLQKSGMSKEDLMWVITFLVKLQPWNRWSTDSNADLHRQHQKGSIQPFLIKLSHVLILFNRLRQRKHMILSGMWNFHILIKRSSGLLETRVFAIRSYMRLDFTIPKDLLYNQAILSGKWPIQIPPCRKPLI